VYSNRNIDDAGNGRLAHLPRGEATVNADSRSQRDNALWPLPSACRRSASMESAALARHAAEHVLNKIETSIPAPQHSRTIFSTMFSTVTG